MSFILDGLKKLEEDRHRNSVPNLRTVHAPELQKTKKHPIWPYLILVALLLNALLISIWLGTWRHEEDISVKKTVITNEETALNLNQPAQKITAVSETYTQKQDTVKRDNIIVNDNEPIKTPIAAETGNIEYSDNIDIESVSAMPFSLPERDDTFYNNAAPVPSGKAIDFRELPLNIRQSLPDISISAHIYSNNPTSRLVNINGNIIREGGTVTPEIMVDEITINGVILKYKDYRFNILGL